tara:strand:+ start:114 stop:338 length:225 start_codon:yes stop_codon:yes gene_type:complete
MAIDYELVTKELIKDLESLAQKDAEFRKKICDGKHNSPMICAHRTYVSALNDVLEKTTKRYNTKYKQINQRFGN